METEPCELEMGLSVLIVTCIEAEGDQRRSRSTVINGADRAIHLVEWRALIPFPEYGQADRPNYANHAAASTLARVIEADGRYTTAVGRLHTHF